MRLVFGLMDGIIRGSCHLIYFSPSLDDCHVFLALVYLGMLSALFPVKPISVRSHGHLKDWVSQYSILLLTNHIRFTI